MERPEPSPIFKHAGKRADSVIIGRGLLEAAERNKQNTRGVIVVPVDGAHYRLSKNEIEHLETQYLIPYYERKEKREVRAEQRLASNVTRFFGIARRNIDVARSCNEIDRELTDFVADFGLIKRRAEFGLHIPYREMTSVERKVVERGSQLVGHIVNRLGRTGKIILNDGDTRAEKTVEDISELILRWSDAPQEDLQKLETMHKPERDMLRKKLLIKDFSYWVDILNNYTQRGMDPVFNYEDSGEVKTFPRSELLRCVITHNNLRDHDAGLGYLVFEIKKSLTDEIKIDEHERMADEKPELVAHYKRREEEKIRDGHEKRTIDGIVTSIGYSCEAIDETALAMLWVLDNSQFRAFIKKIAPAADEVDDEKFNVMQHRDLLRQFTEAARHRCSIDSKDAENFDPAALRFNHLRDEILWLHQNMRADLDRLPSTELGRGSKQPIRDAITLLDRGIELIDSMATERIPRNRNAPEIYDKDLPKYAGRDASSVGRLEAKIASWVKNNRQNKQETISDSWVNRPRGQGEFNR